jgi:HlyD family secretion protein
MSGERRKMLAILAVLAGAAGALGYLWRPSPSTPAPIAGMVRQTEIRIAPEVNGRLARVAVSPGQRVANGDLLATIDNPDLVAALGEAEAALASASAEREHVYSGVRPEEVKIATEAVRTAEANLALARQQNARVTTLAGRGFNSSAQLDESNASLAKAMADLDLKRAQWAAAKAGPIAEERALADAKVALAAAAVADARAKLDKTQLVAPRSGMVGTRVAEIGEVLTPGKPVVTLIPDGGVWLAFTMREDELYGLDIGSRATLRLGDIRVDGMVTELRPLGEFATWRAARAVGDHDLNSFRVRFDPSSETTGLEPGMTALLTVSR